MGSHTDAGAARELVLLAPPEGVTGLSSAEAARRLTTDGPNQFVPTDSGNRWRRILGPLADPMVALLLIAAPTYLLIGDTTDAIVVFVALVPIAGVGWVLEARAERTLAQLRRLTAPTAMVERDGTTITVPTEELVVGDLVWLHEGDIVPADADLLVLTQLLVDESALTGESLPMAKTAVDAPLDASAAASSMPECTVSAGTTVLTGRAIARVVRTGSRTRYGEIGTLVAATRSPRTPLQRALARLVIVLSIAAFVFCVAVVAAELARGQGWGEAVIAGVSLAIAAIPEEFSMVYALYLALGAWQLAKDKALVRRLPGVETLGSTTVICTDKTGTLTRGELSVAATVTADGDRLTSGDANDAHRALLEAAVLACEPEPYDPLDIAIVEHARAHGVEVDVLHAATLVADWPFDPDDKYLTHVWRLADGTYRTAAKGSFEGIASHCGPDGRARSDHDRLAADGMRIIAIAAGTSRPPTGDRALDEQELSYVGLVAFSDPVREGVAEALEECATAGIRVIMITGDHPATAHAVAEGLGLPHEDDGGDVIATGDDLDRASPEAFDALAGTANVFARARPDHKHRLVQSLRSHGDVVAMTGDGTNDAPALQAADIGVAMGRRGTEAAREAATIVLLDDNFATIVAAVRNGRRIYDNLTRAFGYLIAFHPPLMIAALVIPLLGKPLLLLPVQLILLELLLHPVVSLVFQADPADPDVMQRPPRHARSGLGVAALWRPYAIGITLAAGIVSSYLILLDRGWPVEEARAFGFATLLASQPFLIAVERSPHAPLWQTGLRPTPEFAGAVGVIVATTLAVIYVPALADLLAIAAFPPAAWLAVIAIVAVATLWSEPFKDRSGRVRRRVGVDTR
jgi:P-type Ca2+ transporter type 2C